MNKSAARRIELLAIILAAGYALFWLCIVVLVASGHVKVIPPSVAWDMDFFFNIALGSHAHSNQLLEITLKSSDIWTDLGCTFVDVVYFSLLMLYVRRLFREVSTHTRLLKAVETSLHRFAWITILWPTTEFVMKNIAAFATALRQATSHHFEVNLYMGLDVPSVFLGIVLLLVYRVVAYLRPYYDEMKLVV